MDSLLDRVTCVRCAGALDPRADSIACAKCGQVYPRIGRIPVLMPRPDAHIELWRGQLALLLAQAGDTLSNVEAAAAAPDVLADGQTRLRALAQGVRQQVEDIAQIVGSALGGPSSTRASGLPRGVVEYIHYLYRDWGWVGPDQLENERALQGIQRALNGRQLGRTLVLGAGGCRLAYDLHRTCGASETVVLDIDPYLFVIAEAVVRGGSVQLTESSITVHEAERVAMSWTLRAPAGALDEQSFHFLFANGLEPPFLDGSFDTVVTPWFIDRVPQNLESFLATLQRKLAPGGRWLNQGPLLYPEETPLPRRFSRSEVFELAAQAGFRIGHWSSESQPYLVSPLTGRGKVERVLTFEAVRLGH
jgi:SAM-dependent methyltransferase/uncharacterized protein YbaR (Trm112 family)